jgi:predicted ArsR family transcriptional regulator
MVTQPLPESPENTHQAVLHHLKRNNEMTVAELCDVLGVTSMAVRRHLAGLQKDGLVDCRLVRQSRGRPTYRYRLTPKAESLFPSGLATMAFDLLDAVFEARGHQGVMEMLSMRDEFLVKKHRPRLEAMSFEERIQEVVKIYSENGFMTEWHKLPDGNYFISQQHCAVHHLAQQYRQICVLEPKLMESLLGVKVTREKFILKDDPICGYLVHCAAPKEAVSGG